MFVPLYKSFMFLLLVYFASWLILFSDIPSLCSWNVYKPHVLHCSDYLHLFGMDPVTTAIRLVSFDVNVLNILRRNMAYAASVRNNLWPSSVEILYSLIDSQALIILTSSPSTSKFPKVKKLFEILIWYYSLRSPH